MFLYNIFFIIILLVLPSGVSAYDNLMPCDELFKYSKEQKTYVMHVYKLFTDDLVHRKYKVASIIIDEPATGPEKSIAIVANSLGEYFVASSSASHKILKDIIDARANPAVEVINIREKKIDKRLAKKISNLINREINASEIPREPHLGTHPAEISKFFNSSGKCALVHTPSGPSKKLTDIKTLLDEYVSNDDRHRSRKLIHKIISLLGQ